MKLIELGALLIAATVIAGLGELFCWVAEYGFEFWKVLK